MVMAHFAFLIESRAKNAKLYMRSAGVTRNKRTTKATFQFAKIEHQSTTLKRHFDLKDLREK